MRWILRYLGRLRGRQIETALLASGATADEAACHTEALLKPIAELRSVARQERGLSARR